MDEKVRYVIKDREQSPQAEAYRSLCNSIRDEETFGKIQSVLFASASPGDGGTMTAVNSAAALAYAGKNVILVDCDLRFPIVGDGFGLQNIGLTNLVQDEVSHEDILQDTWIPNLRVVASGPIPIGPITTLSNQKIRALFEYLRTLADFIVLTSSPILFEKEYVISDACVLASKVDGVILVIDSRTIKPKEAKKVVELLQGAKANMIGTVLNDVTDY
ncbi:MAG: CpsD/CapB family tyrosine-protein kinase [Negativicutes bacterium]